MSLTQEDLIAIGNILDQKLEPIKSGIDHLKSDVGALKSDVSALKVKIELLSENFVILESRVDEGFKKLIPEVESLANYINTNYPAA